MSRTRDLGKIISGNFDVPATALDNAATAVNTNVSTLAVTRSNISDLGTAALSNRNLVINGAMQVAQRGTSATGVTTSGKIVDRFSNIISNYGTWTREQSNDAPDGFANSFKVTCTTAISSPSPSGYVRISYTAEGQDRQVLSYGTSNAKDVTISFWVKSNVAATYVFWIYQLDSPTNRHINKLYTIDSANTWEYKTITVEGDTLGQLDNNTDSCMIMGWMLAAGSNWKSGTRPSTWTAHTSADRWVGLTADLGGTANSYFQITGVQMELGDTATPFEHRSYGEELAKCQRYFQVLGNNQSNGAIASGYFHATTSFRGQMSYLQRMRAAPTGSTSTVSGFILQGTGGNFTPTSIAVTVNFTEALLVVGIGPAQTAGHGANLLSAAGTAIYLDAEI
jgi:hypothetical protein